jgi:hypothetical protein
MHSSVFLLGNTMSVRFIRTLHTGGLFFSLLGNIPLHDHVIINLFAINEYLKCFQLLLISNKATINILTYVL